MIIHLLSGRTTGDDQVRTICGLRAPEYWRTPALTNVKTLVTCRRCQAWIRTVTTLAKGDSHGHRYPAS